MEAISLQCWTEGFFCQPKAKTLTAEAVSEVDGQRPPRDKDEEEEEEVANEGRERGARRRRRILASPS